MLVEVLRMWHLSMAPAEALPSTYRSVLQETPTCNPFEFADHWILGNGSGLQG